MRRYDVKIRTLENPFINLDLSLQLLRGEIGRIVFLVPSAQGGAASSGFGAVQQPLNGCVNFSQAHAWENSPLFLSLYLSPPFAAAA